MQKIPDIVKTNPIERSVCPEWTLHFCRKTIKKFDADADKLKTVVYLFLKQLISRRERK